MTFEIYKAGLFRRQWYFRIVADNGKIVAQSEGYKNLLDCRSTVGSIRDKVGRATIIVVND